MFTITLPEYKTYVTLNRDRFESLFPDSLISRALELTHESNIELTQLFITPDVMHVLSDITNKDNIPIIPPQLLNSLRGTGNYLGIDLLLIISDPRYPQILQAYLDHEPEKASPLNLANKDSWWKYRDYLLRISILSNFNSLFNYLLDQGVDPSIDYNWAIRTASENGNLPMVGRLIQDPRVDPGDVYNEAIRNASQKGHLAIVNLLLEDSRVNPGALTNRALQLAVINSHTNVVHRLLQDPRLRVPISNNILADAVFDHNIPIIQMLLQDPRIELNPIPNITQQIAIIVASANGYLDVVNLLLSYPEVDPSIDNNSALLGASENNHEDVVNRLLQDPRVNIINAIQTASQKYYHPREAVNKLLSYPRAREAYDRAI